MRYLAHKNGDVRDHRVSNIKERDYTPLDRGAWLELYGSPLPKGYTIVPCAPALGCTDRVCNWWKVVRDGK